MAWWSSTSWYFFDSWIWKNGWARIYSRGPMELTSSAAESEYLDTHEANMGGITRMFQWTGAYWERVH